MPAAETGHHRILGDSCEARLPLEFKSICRAAVFTALTGTIYYTLAPHLPQNTERESTDAPHE